MNIEQQIADYKPYNEQEALRSSSDAAASATQPDFCKENQVAHMTASSWLLNATYDKVLMIYHNIYHSWAWTGGHADGDREPSGGCEARGDGGDRRDRDTDDFGRHLFA